MRTRLPLLAALLSAMLPAGCSSPAGTIPQALRPFPGDAAGAGPAPARGSLRPTLGEVLKLLDERNPGLRALRGSAESAAQDARQADRAPNPSINVSPRLALDEEIAAEGSAGVSQKIEIGKRGPRAREGEAQAEVAQALLAGGRNSLALEAKELFYKLLASQEAVELESENLELLESLERLSGARVEAGAESRDRLLAARVARGRAMVALRDGRRDLEAAASRLDAILDLPQGTVGGGRGTLEEVGRVPTAGEMRAAVSERNLDVLIAARRVGAAQARLERERAAPVPDVTVGLAYQRSAEMAAEREGARDSLGVSLGFPVPLWDANRAGVAAARARVLAAEESVREARQRALESTEASLSDWSKADADAATWESELIPALEEAEELSTASYGAGRTSHVALLESSLDLVAGRRLLLELRLSRALALARLEALAGGAFP